MILITGATGRIGSRVVKRLIDADQSVRVLVRDIEKAKRMLPGNIEFIVGDLADEELVYAAVDSTDAVMLLSPVDPRQVELQGNVVKAALATCQPYIVKISGLGTTLDSYIDSGRWHARTQLFIKSSGLHHTFLCPLFFMQNIAFQLDSARSSGVIRAGVGASKIAMIDADDIADITAKLLIDKNILINKSVTLTSSTAVDYHQVAMTLADVLKRDVRYQQQSILEVQQALRNSGQPEWHINILLQFNRAFLDGMGDAASSIAEEILGRQATTISQYLSREAGLSSSDKSSNPFPS